MKLSQSYYWPTYCPWMLCHSIIELVDLKLERTKCDLRRPLVNRVLVVLLVVFTLAAIGTLGNVFLQASSLVALVGVLYSKRTCLFR